MTKAERATFLLERIGQMPYFDPDAIIKVLVNEFECIEKEQDATSREAVRLLRAVNTTGGVVVEYYEINKVKRPLRDWITELLNKIDGKVTK